MNPDTLEFPFAPSQTCSRCGTEQSVDEDRFQYAMFDSAESSGEFDFGNLCFNCFRDVMHFANGQNP